MSSHAIELTVTVTVYDYLSLNLKVNADHRVDAAMPPIGDGLTLAVER